MITEWSLHPAVGGPSVDIFASIHDTPNLLPQFVSPILKDMGEE